MINNDVLRRVRYALDLSDAQMIEIFALSDHALSKDELLDLLKKEDQDGFKPMNNVLMENFLDGLVTYKRGKLENAPAPAPMASSDPINNIILKKLRIALNYKEDDMLAMFKLADFALSKGELSAFFRKKGHKNYRELGDQILRNFLQGLTLHLRSQVESGLL